MKLVHVRTITLSCMVGFENNLVQIIIMTKQCVMIKNHVVRSKVLGHLAQSVGHLTCKSDALGSIPGLATYLGFSFR